MTNREQHIKAIALAQHLPNHCPRTGQHDFSCPHLEAIECISDSKYRYLDEAAIAYEGLLQSLPEPLRKALEGDPGVAVVEVGTVSPMTPADARNPYSMHDAARYSAGYNQALRDIGRIPQEQTNETD